ncbi:hypothetical protein [Pseudomonas serbica]|jgi:uncharacterized membrane protein|uniref:hypothetical protein n=1 Tax=Pseudomonas serbica TaxID=2965074 RepID=UPI00237A3BCE|nr:hypothetical protein [Pseudomonas serbica]
MYFSYYPILPSLGFSITFFITGLFCTLFNLKTLKAGWRQNLTLDLVLSTLALLLSVPLTVSPLLAWCFQIQSHAFANLLCGFQGMVIFFLALVGMFRTRNDPDAGWRDLGLMILATALMIIPWIVGAQTETI